MDPSPTPPRRFSHWRTTKRTFAFGKSKSTKSPEKPIKKSNSINKSLSKIQESFINAVKDKKNTSAAQRVRKNIKRSIVEHSKETDREDSTETSSVDKENKDRTQVENSFEKIRKEKIRNRIDSPVKLNGKFAPKRKLSVESSEDRQKNKQPKSLLVNRAANENNSHSSDSEFMPEPFQAKRRKKKDINVHSVKNDSVSVQDTASRDKSSQEMKISKRELKRLSNPSVFSNVSVLNNESGGRPRGLRDRSLLMTSEAMRDRNQYPLSFYYSGKKVGSTSRSYNSPSSNTSKDSETSRGMRVNISKSKAHSTSRSPNSPSSNTSKDSETSRGMRVNISKSKAHKASLYRKVEDPVDTERLLPIRDNEITVHVEVTELALRESKVSRQFEVNKNSTSSGLKQGVSNSSLNTHRDDPLVELSAKGKMNNSQNVHHSKFQNEPITNRSRWSEKSKEKLLEVSYEDSETSRKTHRGREKTETDNHFLSKSPHHAVKQKTGKVAEKSAKILENVNSSLLIPPSNHSPQKTVPNPETTIKRHAGLRKSTMLVPPDKKQYPISFYYSKKQQTDSNADDGDVSESSGSKNCVKTHSAKKDAQKPSPCFNNAPTVDKPASKSRELKESKASVSTAVLISNRRVSKSHRESDVSTMSSSPELQSVGSPSPKKMAASPKKKSVKSSQAKAPLILSGLKSKHLESSMDGTVLASQKTQRRRNLIQELETLETPADQMHQRKKKGQSKEVHVWCEEGRSRPGSDVTAYDVLLEHIETMEQKLIEDESDMNSQNMITKVMDDFRSQIETLLLKRLDLKSIECGLKKVKDRCSNLKEEICKQQKINSELSSRLKAIQTQSKDIDLLLASSWMKDYAKLMESLDNKSG